MLKKIFIVLVFFLVPKIHSVTCVSLGEDCSSAAALKNLGLRNAAYPFDWIISHINSLMAALTEDFANHLRPDSLHLRYDHHAIIDYYSFQFPHDFPSVSQAPIADENDSDSIVVGNVIANNWRDFIPLVQQKYTRRIHRLRTLLSSSEKVYFIRHFGMHMQEAIQLRDLLLQKYPNLDFVIVVVDRTPDMLHDWKLDRIRNFHLDDSIIWNDLNQWANIFSSLGIKTTINRSFDELWHCHH